MAITTNEGLFETWADSIETIEQNLENLYGPAAITPVLPSVTTEEGMLEAAAEGTELAAWNFAKMYSYLSTETNTTRIVEVPDTALYYGQFVKIGGHTIEASGELLSAEVTSVISKDATGNTVQTYPIPAEIMSIEGYGWSVGSVYNYVDFERKVFVKNVSRVDMGTLTWTYNNNTYGKYFNATINEKKDGLANLICPKYEVFGAGVASITSPTGIAQSTTQVKVVYVVDPAYTNASAFTTSVSGTFLFYELQTPIEIDISQYLTDTDIKVASGGSLIFDNSNELDVPSGVKYIS